MDLPAQLLDSISGFQAELSGSGADIKLVERENLHFTVKFLGEITESQAGEARARLETLDLRGAAVDVRGAGAFPNSGRPRVVWVGVAPGQETTIGSIAEPVIAALEGIGERDERPFQAHITLGRVRSLRNSRELGDLLRKNSDRHFGTVSLTELKLKSSVLTPAGPTYKDVGVFPLK
jgi:2'-5' RNA ligase